MGFGVTAVSFPEDSHNHKIDIEKVRDVFLKHECAKYIEPTVWSVNDNGHSEAHDGYGFAYCSESVVGKFTMASFRFGTPDFQKSTFLFELANLGKLTIINEQGRDKMWAIPPSVNREHLPASLVEDWGEPVTVCSAEDIQLFFGQSYSEFDQYRNLVIGKDND
jgi:hypothetical protein